MIPRKINETVKTVAVVETEEEIALLDRRDRRT
jgi:hypothetical protein